MISVSSVEREVIGLMNVNIREEGDIHHLHIVDLILEIEDIVIVGIEDRGDLGTIEIEREDHIVHQVGLVDHIVRVEVVRVVGVEVGVGVGVGVVLVVGVVSDIITVLCIGYYIINTGWRESII